MLRVQIALVTYFLCAASLCSAADFPTHIDNTGRVQHKKAIVHAKKITPQPQQIAVQPIAPKDPAAEAPSVKNPEPISPNIANLSWVLGPMTANADGGKRESSASATANIIVDKPGASCGPEMIVELEGHVVKTARSTVRLDIQIGEFKKSVQWNDDEIKAGRFKITLKENVPVGVLPSLIPVSALAFVTQAGDGNAAMVSLERIMLRYPSKQLADAN